MEAVAQLDLPFISEMFGQNGFGITHGDLTPITWDMAKKNCARLKSPNINLHKPPNVYPRGGMKPSTKHFVKAVLESSSFTVVYGCDICEVTTTNLAVHLVAVDKVLISRRVSCLEGASLMPSLLITSYNLLKKCTQYIP